MVTRRGVALYDVWVSKSWHLQRKDTLMALVSIVVANVTSADVVVNGKTAKARTATKLSLDDTTNEAEQFLAAKCGLVSASACTFGQRQELGFMLNGLQNVAEYGG